MTDEIGGVPPDADTQPTPEDLPQATDDVQVPGPLERPHEPIGLDEQEGVAPS